MMLMVVAIPETPVPRRLRHEDLMQYSLLMDSEGMLRQQAFGTFNLDLREDACSWPSWDRRKATASPAASLKERSGTSAPPRRPTWAGGGCELSLGDAGSIYDVAAGDIGFGSGPSAQRSNRDFGA